MTIKVLGQSAPSATTETDLFTAASPVVVSSLVVCNRGALATFRVSVSVGGGATANKDYLYYDLPVAPNDTFVMTVGVTLASTDKMRIYASTGNLSFNLFGEEL